MILLLLLSIVIKNQYRKKRKHLRKFEYALKMLSHTSRSATAAFSLSHLVFEIMKKISAEWYIRNE